MWENIYIKLVTTETRKHLVSEPNCQKTIFFSETLWAIGIERTLILMNKLVYLGLSITQISKIVMCEFCYDYVKLKYREKTKVCHMDTEALYST